MGARTLESRQATGTNGVRNRCIPRVALSSKSIVERETVQAYLETEYRVAWDPFLILKVGQRNPDLLAAHRHHGVDCSTFVTACNPLGDSLSEPDNRVLHRAFVRTAKAQGLDFVQGTGRHPWNDWPGEQSLLVFGLDLEAAKALGRRNEQNAIVWNDSAAIPKLILLR